MQGVRGMTWNCEGFGDTGKHFFVQESIREFKLDFIALLETGRSNFSLHLLRYMSGGYDFSWFCLPPHGRSGGILVGINNSSFQVKHVTTGDFCVKIHLRAINDGFEWVFIPVYGAAQDAHKPEFLSELVRFCDSEPLPKLLGGDFNILRRPEDKNNDNFNPRWPCIFNSIIEHLDLREIGLSGRQFTWANRRSTPTFEKLDRILVSVDWEQKFPLVSVRALARSGSDHTPLLLDSGAHAHLGNHAPFSFELSWFLHNGFEDIVEREWNSVEVVGTPVDIWQHKIRHLRRFLKGWAKNLSGKYKIEKDKLLLIITALDIKAETQPLSHGEREQLRMANDDMNKLRRAEEAKWAQRAKVKHVQEGGNNTKYFHLIANGKNRKKIFFQLEQEEGTIIGEDNLKHYITDYYKTLFGTPIPNSFSMIEDRTSDITQISVEENEILTAAFTEKEVWEAVDQMERNKAPGPDGFPAEFYQRFWRILKLDLMALFHQLYERSLPLFKLNFGVITLLPKKENAVQIQQYRPICLLNVSFKVFTKVATNRISSIAHKIIKPTQTAFMPGRHILEGVVVLHETIHELQKKKLDGVLFKIDFEKAYDKVKWPFLQQTLRMKGFNPLWCGWIRDFIEGGSVGIKVNNDIGHYFQTRKGLRQGDPLSPLLFNLVGDMLAIMIARARDAGQIGCLIPDLVEGGVSILQYADDTILFMEHDLDKAVNMKLILCIFEQLSGLKINFHKSEIYCFGKAKDDEHIYKQIMGCESGSLPFRYLGIPIHHRKLSNAEWAMVENRFVGKLGCWQGKLLSYGDRLVLINSVLTSLPMFMLSFLEIPVGVRKRLDFYRSRFFWQSDENKRKYRLTKWNIICRPKDQGGLGIEVLELKNKCLLSKWLYKILHEDGMWQELLCNKYLHSKTLAQVTAQPTDSPFWKGLMRVKDDFFKRGHFHLGDGRTTRFWEDRWLGDLPLAVIYPNLYNIVQRKHVLVADVLCHIPLNIAFRRNLTGVKWTEWIHLCQRLMDIQLSNEPDKFMWNLSNTGVFTVKSMYLDFMNDHPTFARKYLWKLKIPLKIKIFMWFFQNKVLLTKDNLAIRNWSGCQKCCHCDAMETIEHLFFECPFAKTIWRMIHFAFNISPPTTVSNLFGTWLDGVDKLTKQKIRIGTSAVCWSMWNCRNDIIFNRSNGATFLQVIRMAVHWIQLWSLLLPVDRRGSMVSGCNHLWMVAQVFFNQGGWQHIRRLDV
jgi:hypothetical protein